MITKLNLSVFKIKELDIGGIPLLFPGLCSLMLTGMAVKKKWKLDYLEVKGLRSDDWLYEQYSKNKNLIDLDEFLNMQNSGL